MDTNVGYEISAANEGSNGNESEEEEEEEVGEEDFGSHNTQYIGFRPFNRAPVPPTTPPPNPAAMLANPAVLSDETAA